MLSRMTVIRMTLSKMIFKIKIRGRMTVIRMTPCKMTFMIMMLSRMSARE